MVSLVLTCCPLGADGKPYRDLLARAMYAQANLLDPQASASSLSNRIPRLPNPPRVDELGHGVAEPTL